MTRQVANRSQAEFDPPFLAAIQATGAIAKGGAAMTGVEDTRVRGSAHGEVRAALEAYNRLEHRL